MSDKKTIMYIAFQIVVVSIVAVIFFVFKSKAVDYSNAPHLNEYTIEVHNDAENYTAVYTVRSIDTSFANALDELTKSYVLKIRDKDGIITSVNGMDALEEKTASWIIKVNWDKEYKNINDVPELDDHYDVWLLYTQEKW